MCVNCTLSQQFIKFRFKSSTADVRQQASRSHLNISCPFWPAHAWHYVLHVERRFISMLLILPLQISPAMQSGRQTCPAGCGAGERGATGLAPPHQLAQQVVTINSMKTSTFGDHCLPDWGIYMWILRHHKLFIYDESLNNVLFVSVPEWIFRNGEFETRGWLPNTKENSANIFKL